MSYGHAMTKTDVYFLLPTWAPSSPALGLGAFAAGGPSYLVVLRPPVLDQVPHVVELAGVAPAPGWRLSER